MSGHTKGPWRIDDNGPGLWSMNYDWPAPRFMTKGPREPVGFAVEPSAHGNDEEIEASARLIADLMEVARNFIRWAENPADDAVGMAREQEWLNDARVAITRADGGGAPSAAEGAGE